jgi:hypothetical protein
MKEGNDKMPAQAVSTQTQRNWWIDAILALSGLSAILSGIYFLYLPTGGYQGGRNPYYDLKILFTRHTWEDIHLWGGLAMTGVAAVHLVIHWSWVVTMLRRMWNELHGRCTPMNGRGRFNLWLNLVVALSFSLTALSGVYFWLAPGEHDALNFMFLFSRSAWDMLHTWAGVTFIAAVVVHFAIHWKWVTKVTRNMLGMLAGSKTVVAAARAIPNR